MAEEGGRIASKALFADGDNPQQDTAARKKVSRSPLRARAQHSSDNTASDLDNPPLLFKSPRASPDHNLMQQPHMTMKKKEVDGSASPCPAYSPNFISKPNTPRDYWPSMPATAGVLDRPQRFADRDWERVVANGRESNDGTHLIRLLADFIEEFQFGSSGKGEYASWVYDMKSLPAESRHSHQLAGQLRRLADTFEKENSCLSFRGDRRIK
ncbi:hypothetical protein GOP47_0004974 [Adiantum capillus-veneris]|uniref:Uncharacterized protein n=1 Tax=Adiantum capillus-veneris TaxID=13818 RepID=A0A9D4ZNQ8_ADICA|nr:hypothetical protein GOP47_0004974 [Adiantum capillus-veneris]